MKKLLFAAAFLCIMSGCNCIQDILPDLVSLLSNIIGFVDQSQSTQQYSTWNFTNNFLNSAVNVTTKCACGKSVQTAGPQHVNWASYYSSTSADPDQNWGALLDSGSTIKNALAACNVDSSSSTFQFVHSGYYLITSVLDYYNQVNEKNEGNNDLSTIFRLASPPAQTTIKAMKAKYGNNFSYTIIHVELANEVPVYDANGRQIYARLTKVR